LLGKPTACPPPFSGCGQYEPGNCIITGMTANITAGLIEYMDCVPPKPSKNQRHNNLIFKQGKQVVDEAVL